MIYKQTLEINLLQNALYGRLSRRRHLAREAVRWFDASGEARHSKWQCGFGRTSDRVEEAGQPLGEFLHRYLHSYALPEYLFVFFYLFVAMNIETSNARGLSF